MRKTRRVLLEAHRPGEDSGRQDSRGTTPPDLKPASLQLERKADAGEANRRMPRDTRIAIGYSADGAAGFRYAGPYLATVIEPMLESPALVLQRFERDPASDRISLQVLLPPNSVYSAYHSLFSMAQILHSAGSVQSLF